MSSAKAGAARRRERRAVTRVFMVTSLVFVYCYRKIYFYVATIFFSRYRSIINIKGGCGESGNDLSVAVTGTNFNGGVRDKGDSR